jgi:hypothetical protein
MAHIRVATAQVEERSQDYNNSAGRHHSRSRWVRLRNNNANPPLQFKAEEGGSENEVVQ